MKGRLMRDGLFGPNLRLADTQQVFFFLLVDFDFPTIEIGLEDLNHIRGRIGDQQISGLAIEAMAMSVIRQRRDDDQAQGSPLSATAAENRTDGLVTQLMRTTGGKDRGSLPGHGVILTHLFGSPQIFTVEASSSSARLGFGQSRQMNVFASAADQNGTFGQSAQHREIAIAGIDNDQQAALRETGDAIQTREDIFK